MSEGMDDERPSYIEVGTVNDLAPGERMIVDSSDVSIGVFNVDGELFALENRCAHQSGPVCTGKIQAAVVGEFQKPGERVSESYSDEVVAITCPWHGWEYDVRTGVHLGDPAYSIKSFDVFVEDEAIFVSL